MSPDAGEDVVQLYVDGAEGQEPCTSAKQVASVNNCISLNVPMETLSCLFNAAWRCAARPPMEAVQQRRTSHVMRLATAAIAAHPHSVGNDSQMMIGCNGEFSSKQRACHDHLRYRAPIPGQAGDLARVLVGPHRRAELAARVLAGDAAKHGQRDGHQRPDDEDDHDRAEGQRCRALRLGPRSAAHMHRKSAIETCGGCSAVTLSYFWAQES